MSAFGKQGGSRSEAFYDQNLTGSFKHPVEGVESPTKFEIATPVGEASRRRRSV